VLIDGQFSNITTYAVVETNHFQCFGILGGVESFTRYIYSTYNFDRLPANAAISELNYSSADVESYHTVKYLLWVSLSNCYDQD